ncbi:MAG: helix-turn-helix transcriptional regulator [Anaerolineaceae bacterium]|nr:helix-turn-helix transcriptional regulator [Anaerolineaceae bacterium]
MEDSKKKTTRTSAFLRKLLNSSDIEQFMEHNAGDMEESPFHVYINHLCQALGLVPEQVIKRAGIERTYGHQIFNGTRRPSRDKVIQLAFGLQLDFEGTQELLRAAQKSLLYPRFKRDAAIIYCLQHKKDVMETQSVLQVLDLTLLGDA